MVINDTIKEASRRIVQNHAMLWSCPIRAVFKGFTGSIPETALPRSLAGLEKGNGKEGKKDDGLEMKNQLLDIILKHKINTV